MEFLVSRFVATVASHCVDDGVEVPEGFGPGTALGTDLGLTVPGRPLPVRVLEQPDFADSVPITGIGLGHTNRFDSQE
jgi:hypothetical protein